MLTANTMQIPSVPSVNGTAGGDEGAQLSLDNLHAWEAIADFWDKAQSPVGVDGQPDDGNDMFTQCLLPVVDELAGPCRDLSVLDLGAGSGIIARRFARNGAYVTGLDFSESMLRKARLRSPPATGKPGSITYDFIDLMSRDSMLGFMERRRLEFVAAGDSEGQEKYDIITISTTLKSLPSLDPIAEALPRMLKPRGRIVIVDLHPAFSKPAGHRAMEILEDPTTGKQVLNTFIKVPKYLDIKPSYSEAVRGQPVPLHVFHRPLWSLLEPFFKNGLVLDAMREPAFEGEPDITQAQSYHNFQQTPMLLAFRLRHMQG